MPFKHGKRNERSIAEGKKSLVLELTSRCIMIDERGDLNDKEIRFWVNAFTIIR